MEKNAIKFQSINYQISSMWGFIERFDEWRHGISNKIQGYMDYINEDWIKIDQSLINPVIHKDNHALKYCERGEHAMRRLRGCEYQCVDCGFIERKCDSNCRHLDEDLVKKPKE
jgi:hypothetical protein